MHIDVIFTDENTDVIDSGCLLVQLGHVIMMRMMIHIQGYQLIPKSKMAAIVKYQFLQGFLPKLYEILSQMVLEHGISMLNRGFYIHYSRQEGITVSINLEFNS